MQSDSGHDAEYQVHRASYMEVWALLIAFPALILVGTAVYLIVTLSRPGIPIQISATFKFNIEESAFDAACDELVNSELFNTLRCPRSEARWHEVIDVSNARDRSGYGFWYKLDKEDGMSIAIYSNRAEESCAIEQALANALTSSDTVGAHFTMTDGRTGTVLKPEDLDEWFANDCGSPKRTSQPRGAYIDVRVR